MQYTYTDLDTAEAALEAGLRDVAGDNPEMAEDDYAADIVESVALECDTATAKELCRTQLGFVPSGLRRLRPDLR